MMSKASIVIIDDDTEYLMILTDALVVHFEVNIAASLAAANLVLIDNKPVDIVLVNDYVAEEDSALWVKLKVSQGSNVSSFVLYSSLVTENAILKGLECGADDYIAKPVAMLALISRMQNLINYQNKTHQFENALIHKNPVVQLSMGQICKYNNSLQLIARLNQCDSITAIRDEVFTYFCSINIDGCISFYPVDSSVLYYSSTCGYCAPIEIKVIKLLRAKAKVYHFGSRTIFNHPLLSILVLNLEYHSFNNVYVDTLSCIIDCIGARIKFISYLSSMITIQQEIKKQVILIKKMLQISQHHQTELINEITVKLTQSYALLKINSSQQKYVKHLLKSTIDRYADNEISVTEVADLLDSAQVKVNDFEQCNDQYRKSSDSSVDQEDSC